MKTIVAYCVLVGLVLVGMSASAAAATAVMPQDGALLDFAKPVFDAVTHGQYWLGASLALVFACALARKYGVKRYPSWGGDFGGTLLMLGMSFGGALATTLAGPGAGAISFAMLAAAGKVAIGAAGGYTIIKKLVADPIMASKWYADKCPAWAKTAISLALWMFLKPSAGEAKQAEAAAAGEAAVEAKPSTGTEGVLGKPEEL